MSLTPAQKVTLKAYILADPVMSVLPNNDAAANQTITNLLNATVNPAFVVWKTNVSITDVGKNFNGTELAGLTTGNQTRLQTLAVFLKDGINPSLASNRAFFDDVFSGAGGTNTRAALLALWKRPAKLIEKIFATGTGSDAVPATLTFEGEVTIFDVDSTRNS